MYEPPKPPPPPKPMEEPPLRIIKSEEIFRGANQVLIQHQGAVYRLRITGAGKLILTK